MAPDPAGKKVVADARALMAEADRHMRFARRLQGQGWWERASGEFEDAAKALNRASRLTRDYSKKVCADGEEHERTKTLPNTWGGDSGMTAADIARAARDDPWELEDEPEDDEVADLN